ncbi:efflux RND transporter permease subunit [Camelimonas abortus]|uniref:Efflux pump membrane transporter n=1 Tax=Camelimonas abortus TaxID=1017184 RepID=A0ABV7LBC9_9HYPH
MTKFFIERPILANVIAILTILLGMVAVFNLPVAQYPNIVPPTVQVTARYPGASAEVVAREVGLPIEQKVNGVEGMIYMSSTSASDGTYTLTVTFAIGSDPDKSQILVQNRVSTALAQLPSVVQNQGVQTVKRSTSILEIITLTSTDPRQDSLYLSNYATINLVDELSRLPGVGGVTVFGAGQYAMRVWLDPQKMQARSLTPADVAAAINAQNRPVASGQLGAPPTSGPGAFQYTLRLDGRLEDVSQFENIILKAANDDGGRVTRLSDVARVELGAQTYSQDFRLDGQAAAGVAIFQLPDANALQVAETVNARMAELARSFPPGMSWSAPFNTTLFVQAAMNDVYHTLVEAAVLVLLVILIFLQDWRATLVPATTVPVTIIGAFAAMAALGFTVNMSTLLAIVLAIGIVVDDAIVVVEGVAKHMERGLSSHDATILAMKELTGPILGITLVLMAVFLPAAFLPGLSGQMYRQFALVIAATALISAINAMTLKPAQSALWLRPPKHVHERNVVFRAFEACYQACERAYVRMMQALTRHYRVVFVATLGLVGLSAFSLSRVPTALLPVEDQGYFLTSVQLPDGATLDRTRQSLATLSERFRKVPGVTQVIAIAGISPMNDNASLANAGVLYVMLKDWSERGPGENLPGMYRALSAAAQNLPDGMATVLPPPPIQGIGNASGFTMKVELRDGSFDYVKLQRAASAIAARALATGDFVSAVNTFSAQAPQVTVNIDRTRTETLGVPFKDAADTLGAYVGSSYVGQFIKFGRVFQVYTQADASQRADPNVIGALMVRNKEGRMTPLGAVADIESTTGPSLVSLYNMYPAATLVGSPVQGVSSGQAMQALARIAGETLPPGMGFDWSAMSYQEAEVGNQIFIVYAISLLLVYLVLAGQYESWYAPMAIMLSVPLALLGTASGLLALGLASNLYTQIGLILLIALSAKNAILIVGFARDQHLQEGRPVIEAAVEAARLRLRPILMTSLAFGLGLVPLVLADSAGANAQRSIGFATLTGMLGSTLLSITVTPSLFIVLQNLENRRKAKKAATAAPAGGAAH